MDVTLSILKLALSQLCRQTVRQWDRRVSRPLDRSSSTKSTMVESSAQSKTVVFLISWEVWEGVRFRLWRTKKRVLQRKNSRSTDGNTSAFDFKAWQQLGAREWATAKGWNLLALESKIQRRGWIVHRRRTR